MQPYVSDRRHSEFCADGTVTAPFRMCECDSQGRKFLSGDRARRQMSNIVALDHELSSPNNARNDTARTLARSGPLEVVRATAESCTQSRSGIVEAKLENITVHD